MTPGGTGALVHVLGPVRVLAVPGPGADAVEVDLGRPLHRRLLACLVAADGAPVPFTTAIDRVWGERGTSSGNLHAVVSRLRDRLGQHGVGHVLRTEGAAYRLDLGPDAVDARVFTGEVARARAETDPAAARLLLRTALSRWAGEAYADVPLPFAEQEAVRLGELRLVAEETLAELDLEAGHHGDVAARLVPLVAAHPLREGLRGSLVLALYRAGRQGDALAAYEEGRRAAVDELGVDPGPALRRLQERILQQDPELLAVDHDRSPVTAPSAVARLVGRAEPLGRLREVLGRGTGTPQVAVVSGEAGIGKTVLVEAATDALPDDVVVAVGSCWEHEGVPPLWPWEQLLGSLAEQVGEPEVTLALQGRGAPAAMLVRGSGTDAPDAAGAAAADGPPLATARTRLYAGVAAFLGALAARRRVVVVLEDAHWADDESVALAEYVVASLDDVRLGLVVTLRDPAGATPSGRPGRDPGGDLLAALSRRRLVVSVHLAGLDVEAVRELAARHTEAEVDQRVAGQLLARTEGNPFYVEELARLLDDERHAGGRADVPVPPSVRAVVDRRLRLLPLADQEVLRVAAVAGRGVEVPLLAQVLDLPRHDLLTALDHAVRAGLVVADPVSGEPRFSHALVQETLVGALGAHRTAEVHGRLAAVLEQRPADDPAAVALVAHHHLAAGASGDPARAAAWALRAGRLAEGRLSVVEAERLVRRALDLLPLVDAAERVPLELDARLHLAGLLTQRLGYSAPDVDTAWRAALRLARTSGSTSHVMAALWGTWHNAITSSYVGDHSAALAVCATIEAAARETGDPTMQAVLHLARGQTLWHEGLLRDSHADLRLAVEQSDRLDDDELMRLLPQHPGAQARAWLAVTTAMVGTAEESDAVAAAAVAQCAALDHAFTTVYCDVVLALRGMWLGRPEEAAALAERATTAAGHHDLAQLQVFALLPAAWADVVLDEPARGADRLERLVLMAEAIDGHLPFAAWLILVLLAAGRAADGTAAAVQDARHWHGRALEAAHHQLARHHLDLVDEVGALLGTTRPGRGLAEPPVRRDVARRLGRAMMAAMVDKSSW